MNSGRGKPWFALAAFTVLAVALFSLVDDYGMSWDEQRRWRSGDQKLDYYERLWASDEKWETMQESPKDVYPGLYDVPLALLRRYTDLDPVRLSHVANLCFGLFGVAGCFLLARLYFQSSERFAGSGVERWGPYLAVLLLLTMPEFFGHLFINPKDIPFAATYTFGLWAVARLVLAAPVFRIRDTLLAGVAVGMCMSSRPPGIVLLGYAFVAGLWAVCSVSKDRGGLKGNLWRLFGHGAVMALLALVVLFLFWPASHRNPFTSSVEAVGTLRTFSQTIPVLFGGEMYTAGDTPAYYVVWMFIIKASVPVLALLGGGVVASVLQRCKEGGSESVDSNAKLLNLILWLSVLFPAGYVLARQPAIHNGFRHMLYILPPLMVLLVAGWARLLHSLKSERHCRLAWLALGGALLLSVVNLARLHPYQYIYYNPIVGGTSGALNRYETEYWFTSGKEALETLEATRQYEIARESGLVPVMIAGPLDAVTPLLPDGMRIVTDSRLAKFYIGNTQMRTDLLVEGEELFRIERMGLPIVIVKEL